MQFRALTAAERFEALKNNEIDVLIRNTTWTQSRDTDIGMQFVTCLPDCAVFSNAMRSIAEDFRGLVD